MLRHATASRWFRPPEPATSRALVQPRFLRICKELRPLAGRLPGSYMHFVQAPRGCTKQPVRPTRADLSHFAQHRGYAMRTFDLAPLYRSTVGFDRLFSMLDGFEAAPGYPPYNIERTGDNS